MKCDTKLEKGSLIAGKEYGGGREFPFPDGSVIRSSNITPDRETGIGSWTTEQFIALFRARSDSATLANKLKTGQFNSIMPWTMYGKMTKQDLEALFTYLRSVKPIKNSVERYTSAQ